MPADWSPLWLCLRAAGLSTAISLALGPWLAFALRKPPGGGVADTLLVFGPAVFLLYALRAPAFQWPMAGLVAAAFGVPFVMRSATAAFAALDPVVENAARSLGASEWRVFWAVSARLAWRPIARAGALVFAIALTECAAALFRYAR